MAQPAVLREQATPRAQRWVRQLEQFPPRVARVIDQTARRIVHGKVVPAQDKLVSLLEPHTQIIVRRKTGKPVEFGRKVWREEVGGGFLSGYHILAEAGQDFPYVPDSLAAHQRRFGLDRCRDHGEEGLGRWVDWGIVTANPMTIVHTLAIQSPHRPARAT